MPAHGRPPRFRSCPARLIRRVVCANEKSREEHPRGFFFAVTVWLTRSDAATNLCAAVDWDRWTRFAMTVRRAHGASRATPSVPPSADSVPGDARGPERCTAAVAPRSACCCDYRRRSFQPNWVAALRRGSRLADSAPRHRSGDADDVHHGVHGGAGGAADHRDQVRCRCRDPAHPMAHVR